MVSELLTAQKEVIEQVMAGGDVLAVMPTGQGKSLCYQLPALILPGLSLVISPLVALMKVRFFFSFLHKG
jgi:ATP-dependent DNA helicase RecQ